MWVKIWDGFPSKHILGKNKRFGRKSKGRKKIFRGFQNPNPKQLPENVKKQGIKNWLTWANDKKDAGKSWSIDKGKNIKNKQSLPKLLSAEAQLWRITTELGQKDKRSLWSEDSVEPKKNKIGSWVQQLPLWQNKRSLTCKNTQANQTISKKV